jgi:predicted nucleic acid-binding protein
MTVLVDTSVWADHFRAADGQLSALLGAGMIRMHPFVLGELALGNLHDWRRTVDRLRALPSLPVVSHDFLLDHVAEQALVGTGIGFVDAHLLAAADLSRTRLWTRDKRLHAHAERLGLDWTN